MEMMNKPTHRYASKTYDHPSYFVRFPHRKRNKLVSCEIIEASATSWLDYGAGDGALLGNLLARGALPGVSVLYEPDAGMRSQLFENVFALGAPASVKLISELPETGPQFDLVTALEVLEHLPLPERMKFYRFLASRLAPGGKVLIELPVEHGPALLLKEWGRKFLKKRMSRYSFRELMNAVIFAKVFDAHSRYLKNDQRSYIATHRGFDLNRLIMELTSIGSVQEVVKSPFTFLPRVFNQTILFSFEIRERDAERIEDAVMQTCQLSN